MSNAMSVSLISSVHLSQQLLLEVDQNTSLLSLLNVSTALQGRGGRVFGFNHWFILPRGHQPSQHNSCVFAHLLSYIRWPAWPLEEWDVMSGERRAQELSEKNDANKTKRQQMRNISYIVPIAYSHW